MEAVTQPIIETTLTVVFLLIITPFILKLFISLVKLKNNIMKANELRLGNYVNDRLGLIELGVNGRIEFSDVYNPIPLTEEWLLKFGFEYSPDDENSWYNLKYGNFNFASDYSVEFKQVFIYLNKTDIICNYVHQLQNLYFALTNKELTL